MHILHPSFCHLHSLPRCRLLDPAQTLTQYFLAQPYQNPEMSSKLWELNETLILHLAQPQRKALNLLNSFNLLNSLRFGSVHVVLNWLIAELWSVSVARVETCGQALLGIHIVARCTLESLELLSPWKPWTIAAIWTIGTIASITQFDTVLSLARAPWAWVSWAQVTTWFAGSCLQVAHARDCQGGKKSSQTFRWFGITAHISDQLIHLTVISEQR